MARLYTNENFPLPAAEELRRLGHDVRTVQEDDQANASLPDSAVLQLACAENRALVTLNRRHFIRLHSLDINHQGIIVCTFDPDFVGLARRIHAEIESRGMLAKELVRINRPVGK